MQGGDISNVTAPRLLVTYEALTRETTEDKKVLGFRIGSATHRVLDPVATTRLWRYTQRVPLVIEMVNYGASVEEAQDRLAALDERGANAVNFSTAAYRDIEDLLEDLPYRPDVIGVMDVPENVARYGRWGIETEYLDRVI